MSVRGKLKDVAEQKYSGSYRYFKKNFVSKYFGDSAVQMIIDYLDEDLQTTFPFMTYCYVNQISQSPKCDCGNNLPFNNSKKQFAKYCSNSCRFENMSDIIEIRKETNLKKYGTTNALANEDVKNKIRKNNLSKYGVDHYTKTEEYRKSVTGKPLSQKHSHNIKSGILKKSFDEMSSKFDNFEPLFTLEEYSGVKAYKAYKWLCKSCDQEIYSHIDNGCSPRCKTCDPVGTKHERFVCDLLDTWDIEYDFNTRDILPSGKEVDIYIPSRNLGIEVCGLYWHSTSMGCGRSYHKNKLDECISTGNDLITIFDDEFYQKKSIVVNRLKHKLKLAKRSIFARKCSISEIDSKTYNKFCNKYHIQGSCNSSIRYGLFYNDRLVSVMGFGKGRYVTGKVNTSGYELIRYCTVANFNIVGGAGKLYKHFIRGHDPKYVYSFADRRWNTGGLYESLGMGFVKNTNPNYYYTKDCVSRSHRSLYQKHKLVDMEHYDVNLSESEIMKLEKFHKIYDCGSKLFEIYY